MTTRQKHQITRALLTKRDELHALLANREPIEATREADPVDDGLQYSARSVATALMDRERAVLRQVEDALSRLEDGTFGFCTECGAEIPAKRLAAVPWSPLCRSCQEAEERERMAICA